MAKKKSKEKVFVCPIGKFFLDLEESFGRKSEFAKYMIQSRIEFLRAIRSLVDERIGDLEKKQSDKAGKKMQKIKVK